MSIIVVLGQGGVGSVLAAELSGKHNVTIVEPLDRVRMPVGLMREIQQGLKVAEPTISIRRGTKSDRKRNRAERWR